MNSAVAVLALAVWIVFFTVRPSFLSAMREARLVEIRLIGMRIEALAHEGRISRKSAFYLFFRPLSKQLGCLPADTVPGPLVVLTLVLAGAHKASGAPSPDDLVRMAVHELEHDYRQHAHLIRDLAAAIGDVFRFKSWLVWAAMFLIERLLGLVGLLSLISRLNLPKYTPSHFETHAAA